MHAIRANIPSNKCGVFGSRAILMWGPLRGCGAFNRAQRADVQTLSMWTKNSNRLVTCGTYLCMIINDYNRKLFLAPLLRSGFILFLKEHFNILTIEMNG